MPGSLQASRWRGIAGAAGAIAAVAIAIAVAGRGCGVEETGPRATVRALLTAAEAGDHQAVFELLSPETRAGLERSAKRATDLVGGSERYAPADLISIGDFDENSKPKEIRIVEQTKTRATVAIVDNSGRQSELTLVLVDGHWKVHLPGFTGGL